jgi:ketosteroid isomerase-like protein
MRRVLSLLAVPLALVSASAVRADDKAEINALYAKATAAVKARDAKAIQSLETPDFVEVLGGTKLNGAQTAEMMAQQFKVIKKFDTVRMSADKIDVKGKTAVVTAGSSFTCSMTGQDGKSHKMASKVVTKDTLTKTPKGWLFSKVESLSDSTTMDGKPFGAPSAGKAGK